MFPPYRINTELVVKFVRSRDGGPMAIIDGKISFPARRSTQTAQIGQRWLVEVTGTNAKGTVYFLRLIERCVYNPRPDGRRKLWLDLNYDFRDVSEPEGPCPQYHRSLHSGFYHPALENVDRQELYDDVDFEELFESDTESAFDDFDDPESSRDFYLQPAAASIDWHRRHFRDRK